MEALEGRDNVVVRALYAGQRIDLRKLEGRRLATQPLVVEAGNGGAAVLFRYGAVVLFGVAPVEEASFLSHLQSILTDPFDKPFEEEATLVFDPEGVERPADGEIRLLDRNVERLQVVADVLAKSVVLESYEHMLKSAFDQVEPIAARLAEGRTGGMRGRKLVGHIGRALLAQTKTVGRVEVTEKPEVLWERPDLELLYARLADEYELSERDAAVDRKLGVVANTAQTLLDLLQTNRSLRVEWYIVLLILVEIVLTLYELFVR